jgi:hypothetical protein
VVYALDEQGNTRGGIRTPLVDAPIAKHLGAGNTGAPGAPPTSRFCFLFGETVPFTAADLATLYPTHGSYVSRFYLASLKAVKSQFLLRADANALLRAAARSDIRK